MHCHEKGLFELSQGERKLSTLTDLKFSCYFFHSIQQSLILCVFLQSSHYAGLDCAFLFKYCIKTTWGKAFPPPVEISKDELKNSEFCSLLSGIQNGENVDFSLDFGDEFCY